MIGVDNSLSLSDSFLSWLRVPLLVSLCHSSPGPLFPGFVCLILCVPIIFSWTTLMNCLLYLSRCMLITETDRSLLQQTGWIYFHFLFLYSGLEFTLCFLTHMHFNYSRSVFVFRRMITWLISLFFLYGLFNSMQQGKMFLFMGLVMAASQGSIARRIPSGKELLYAMIVRPFAKWDVNFQSD